MRGALADRLVVAVRPCNGGGAKGPGHRGCVCLVNRMFREERMDKLKSQVKPFEILKWEVWEAYGR